MTAVVTIIGAGLAGCEAAHQLARRGVSVRLYEMRPLVKTPVHKTNDLAELVCSNSFRSDDPEHPVGLIKREMSAWNSLIMAAARENALPAGGALAVDREGFSKTILGAIESNPRIELIRQEITRIPDGPTILAAGPLCSDELSKDLYRFLGDQALYFYDAIAPVIEYESLNHDVVFAQSRYGKGDGQDYLNIPLDFSTYQRFHQALIQGERVGAKPHEKMIYFEGCLPVEVMAERGFDTLRFGPMKPVGLKDPRTGEQPYAVIQLRQDNFAKSLWNMVGFQTQLKWGDQKEIFSSLPGLEKARFVRFGMIHRNTYVNSPQHLLPTFQFRERPNLFLAGQISGVEGYVESAASGLMAGFQMTRFLNDRKLVPFPDETALGSLAHYVSFSGHRQFQPTNINFGIMPPLSTAKRMKKKEKRRQIVQRAIERIKQYAVEMDEPLARVEDWEPSKETMPV